jgi:hypothetical protein
LDQPDDLTVRRSAVWPDGRIDRLKSKLLFGPLAVGIFFLQQAAGLRGPIGLVHFGPQRGEIGQRLGMLFGKAGIEQVDVQEGQQGLLFLARRLVAVAQNRVGPGVQFQVFGVGLGDDGFDRLDGFVGFSGAGQSRGAAQRLRSKRTTPARPGSPSSSGASAESIHQ